MREFFSACLRVRDWTSFAASAQVGTELGRARIQSLKEMHKPYDVKTAQSLPTGGPADTNTAVSKREPSARPEIIAFPG